MVSHFNGTMAAAEGSLRSTPKMLLRGPLRWSVVMLQSLPLGIYGRLEFTAVDADNPDHRGHRMIPSRSSIIGLPQDRRWKWDRSSARVDRRCHAERSGLRRLPLV